MAASSSAGSPTTPQVLFALARCDHVDVTAGEMLEALVHRVRVGHEPSTWS